MRHWRGWWLTVAEPSCRRTLAHNLKAATTTSPLPPPARRQEDELILIRLVQTKIKSQKHSALPSSSPPSSSSSSCTLRQLLNLFSPTEQKALASYTSRYSKANKMGMPLDVVSESCRALCTLLQSEQSLVCHNVPKSMTASTGWDKVTVTAASAVVAPAVNAAPLTPTAAVPSLETQKRTAQLESNPQTTTAAGSSPSSSPSSSSSSSSVEDTRRLAERVEALIPMYPTVFQIATLYGMLERSDRNLIRETYGSLSHFLKQRSEGGHRVVISNDGLRVTRLLPDGRLWAQYSPTEQQLVNPVIPVAPPSPPSSASHSRSGRPAAPPVPSHLFSQDAIMTENLLEIYETPLDSRFEPPAPPAFVERSRSESRIHNKVGVGHAGVFTIDMIASYLPMYFIPMSSLLASLPEGYTEEHIEGVFGGTRAVEVIRLEGHAFVRMHAAANVDLASAQEAHLRYPQFEPDPFLCDSFVFQSRFPDRNERVLARPYKWAPLRAVVECAPPAVSARLPFQRYQSLLFFAQMRHRFEFAAEGAGSLCAVENVEELTEQTTPVPLLVREVMKLLDNNVQVGVRELMDELSPVGLRLALSYFGTMEAFLRAHKPIFSYCDVQRVAELASAAESRRRQNMSIEERLEEAILKGEKRDVRKYRRKLAIAKDPNNPLIDRERLMEAVKLYLPKKRSIPLRRLMKNLPPDMVDLFPSDQISLFRTSPQHFQIFELRTKGRLHVMLAGLPLPEGHLRTKYDEGELLHMCAASLVDHPRLMVDVYSRLPWGAREQIRTQYKGLFQLLAKYPQNFTIVFKEGKQKLDSRGATVTMVQPPARVATLVDADWGHGVEEEGSHPDDDDDEGGGVDVAESLGEERERDAPKEPKGGFRR